jgi:hypothetical protein
VTKGWAGTTRSAKEKGTAQSASPLRHVFAGFATFNEKGSTSFRADIDTESAIERRCAWRILYDVGLAPDWGPDFGLDFTQVAKTLRATISAAKAARRMRSRSSF